MAFQKADAAPVMSAFERRRLENIQQNNALLKGAVRDAAKLLPPPKKAAPSSTNRKRAAPSTTATAGRPRRETKSNPSQRQTPVATRQGTRQSSRLAGMDAKSEADSTMTAQLGLDIDHRPKKKVRVGGDLSLDDISVEGRKWVSGVDGMAGLKDLDLGTGLLFRGAQPGVRTFTDEDVKHTQNQGLKDLRVRMGALRLYEKWAVNDIKITPERVYSMGFHPTRDKPIIFAGDKEGALGVFDASQEPTEIKNDDDEDDNEPTYADPVVSAFRAHTRTISTLHFSPVDANAVFSGSYDASIRKLDLSQGKSVQVWAPTDGDADDAGGRGGEALAISAIDIAASDPHVIVFSTLQGALGRCDTRAPASEADIWELTDGTKIGGFSLHPLHAHLAATASLDRTLKIWDLRAVRGKGELRPALLGEHAARLSVSHASWSAGGHVATSSYDDKIRIHNFADAGSWPAGQELAAEAMGPAHVVGHNNQTGRWVTILKPQWQRAPGDGIHKFVIGNMNRFVDVFAADGEQLAQLGGDGITAVPAVAHCHPSRDWVAGGTASGKLCLWM